MDESKKAKRGGSDTARERGLTGVVVHLTQEERTLIGIAAASKRIPVKEFVRLAALEAARKIPKNLPDQP